MRYSIRRHIPFIEQNQYLYFNLFFFRNDFNQLVAEEYVKLFNFQGDTLDRALRKFVKQFTIIGEAQDRERVLHFFAARYLDCNPTTFTSVGQ
jgi:PH/SEC7 domain-containing protein